MTDLTQIPLQELRQRCQEQRETYKRSSGKIKGQDCDEIVRRACQHNTDAWRILLEISIEIATNRCPYPEEKDDFAQTVALRLIRRNKKTTRPLIFSSFAHYHAYINTTIEHVRIEMAKALNKKQQRLASLDALSEDGNHEPFQWDNLDDRIEQQRLFNLCLSILTNPLEREVFLRRYHRGETITEIVEDLKILYPEIDAAQVYDLAANAIRRVRKIIHNLVNKSEDRS